MYTNYFYIAAYMHGIRPSGRIALNHHAKCSLVQMILCYTMQQWQFVIGLKKRENLSVTVFKKHYFEYLL